MDIQAATACPALDRPVPFPQPGEGYGLGRPPFRDDQLGVWVVSAYADVDRVVRDGRTFSSRYVLGPGRGETVGGLVARIQDDARGSVVMTYCQPAGLSDGEAHRRERSFFNRAFLPARIDAYEPTNRALCERSADAIVGRSETPFVREFAVPLSVQTIAHALGMPPGDYLDLKRWSDGLEGLTTLAPTPGDLEAFMNAAVEFTEYITPLIEQRRREQTGDIISEVVGENDEGERLTTEEALAMLAALLLAGNETTTAALSGTVLYLARELDLQAQVRADPALIPPLVEKGLRLTAPAQALLRTATADTEVGDAKIAKGEHLYIRFAAANDSARFDQLLRPRLDRPDRRHLTFGKGPHVCPGTPLARAELRIAVETLLARSSLISLSSRDDAVVPTGSTMTTRVGELYLNIAR